MKFINFLFKNRKSCADFAFTELYIVQCDVQGKLFRRFPNWISVYFPYSTVSGKLHKSSWRILWAILSWKALDVRNNHSDSLMNYWRLSNLKPAWDSNRVLCIFRIGSKQIVTTHMNKYHEHMVIKEYDLNQNQKITIILIPPLNPPLCTCSESELACKYHAKIFVDGNRVLKYTWSKSTNSMRIVYLAIVVMKRYVIFYQLVSM